MNEGDVALGCPTKSLTLIHASTPTIGKPTFGEYLLLESKAMSTQLHVTPLIIGRKAMLNFLVACAALMLPLLSINVGVYAQGERPRKPDQVNTVYVDLSNTTCIEDGSSAHPFNTLSEGIAAVSDGGEILIRPGDYGDKPTVNSPMTWRTTGDVVTIGQGNVGTAFCYKVYIPFLTLRR